MERRLRLCTSVILALCLLALTAALTGCATGTGEIEPGPGDWAAAFATVTDEARAKAVTDLFMRLNAGSEAMVSDDCGFLLQKRNDIPGMDKLLSDWSTAVREFAIGHYQEFSQYIETMIAASGDEPSGQILEEGVSSVSEHFDKTVGETMVQDIFARTAELDTTAWGQVLVQYDAWCATRKLAAGEENPAISPEAEDGRKVAATAMVEAFFQYMEDAEILFRTTPNPELDDRIAYILGLD